MGILKRIDWLGGPPGLLCRILSGAWLRLWAALRWFWLLSQLNPLARISLEILDFLMSWR